MGIEKHDRNIDGYTIIITQFDGRSGFKNKLRLLKLLAPLLGGTIASLTSMPVSETASIAAALDTQLDFSKIGHSIEGLLATVDEDIAFNLIHDLIKTTFINGKEAAREDVFNDIFSANYALLYKLIYQILEVNYGNLFTMGNIGSMIKDRFAVAPKTILPKKEST